MDAAKELQDALDGAELTSLDGLTDAELQTLTKLILHARRRQAAALAAAREEAADHIPRLLRAPVRKIVGG